LSLLGETGQKPGECTDNTDITQWGDSIKNYSGGFMLGNAGTESNSGDPDQQSQGGLHCAQNGIIPQVFCTLLRANEQAF